MVSGKTFTKGECVSEAFHFVIFNALIEIN